MQGFVAFVFIVPCCMFSFHPRSVIHIDLLYVFLIASVTFDSKWVTHHGGLNKVNKNHQT